MAGMHRNCYEQLLLKAPRPKPDAVAALPPDSWVLCRKYGSSTSVARASKGKLHEKVAWKVNADFC